MKKLRSNAVSAVVISAFLLSSCASAPDKISAQYVSPLVYQDLSCRQIRGELERVSRKVQEITGVQDKESSKDAWAMGVGLVVFWPALFFLIGDDKKEELGHLKGEYEALEQTAIKKDCAYVKELQDADKKRKEAEAKRKEEESSQSRKNFNN